MLKEMMIDWGMWLIELKVLPGIHNSYATRTLGELNAEMMLWALQSPDYIALTDAERDEIPDEIHELFPYKRRGEKSTREVDE